MHPFLRPHIRIRQQGQTLVIALIVLGVLLILGLVFLGLINRNILSAARSQRRSESSDLAEAGIRYAHGQLVSSPLGADWRGLPTALTPTVAGGNLTGDPDAYYLRPASNPPIRFANGQLDLGGPDGFGPYVRVNFPGGRSLVRVRYGAADASPTTAVPGGPLRNLGAARSTLIIEGVGRTGVVNANDPTTFNSTNGLQFRGFANEAALRQGIAAMAAADGQQAASRRMVAYVPIGIIDAARFVTNVFNSSEPIDLGVEPGLNATSFRENAFRANSGAGGTDQVTNLEMTLGSPGVIGKNVQSQGRYGGSLIVNGNLLLHGTLHAYLNRTLGDSIRVAGRIYGQDVNGAPAATLALDVFSYVPATNSYVREGAGQYSYTLTDGGGASFDSQDPTFSTVNGLLMDGSARTDIGGFPSGVGALVPPSILTVDPETKLNRYVAATRESGVADDANGDQRNSGQFGHGGGVYVDNVSDRQEAKDALGRSTVGSQQSLFDDMLHPGSNQPGSGWKGPFYVPRGASVQLLPDGFLIQRDGSAPAGEQTWKDLKGGETGLKTMRYRIGRVSVNGVPKPYVLDTVTALASGQNINDTTLDYSKGMPFNGVLYFEGNARVRGTIPTSIQMTLVSGATIYIDGPITKGIVNNDWTAGTAGAPITSLPTATLMLMAKDNVVVNTTMFFGPTTNQTLQSVNDNGGASTISPVEINAAGGPEAGQLETTFDLGFDDSLSNSPNTWLPFALTYRDWNNNNLVPTQFLIAHTMADGAAAASFEGFDLNFGVSPAGTTAYPFQADDGLITNTAAAYTGAAPGNTIPLYGLGAETWQRYGKFETRAFPLFDPSSAGAGYNAGTGRLTQAAPYNYQLLSNTNNLLIRPGAIGGVSTNNLYVGRVAVTPADVRIEASMFAEQGSFFVLPGPWFNPSPNDTHLEWAARVAQLVSGGMSLDNAKARANRDRLEKYGSAPAAPFYGEPLDVRLSIVGSVSENLPPPISTQSEWVRKWGWIPVSIGATGVSIPKQHVPGTTDAERKTYASSHDYVPNLSIQYDPVLATGRVNDNAPNTGPIRTDDAGRPLPPMPRLPVSPKLSYFGEL